MLFTGTGTKLNFVCCNLQHHLHYAKNLAVTSVTITSTLPEETYGLADLMLHNVGQDVYNLSRGTKQVWTSNFADKAHDPPTNQ